MSTLQSIIRIKIFQIFPIYSNSSFILYISRWYIQVFQIMVSDEHYFCLKEFLAFS